MISTSELCQLLTLLASVTLSSAIVFGQNDNCMFQESTIQIDKDIYIEQGFYARCLGTATVKKCEGICDSSVTPSVQFASGFRRNCRCCREIATTTKSVTLTCHQANSENVYPHQISVKEVMGCNCTECLD